MTPESLIELARGLTEGEREALIGAFAASDGELAPAYSTGSVLSLEKAGLCRSKLPWSRLTRLGLALRQHLLAQEGME